MNARVLFVDDEPRVLQGLENLLFDAPDDWELEFVESGAAAVEKLKSESYEVLVTDMRMPGMDGAELLDRARQISPSMVRIVLSGHTEQEAAERAIVLAHEFLSKPCETDKLIETLDWAFTLGAATAPTLRKAVGALVSLPARPDVHRRLNEMAQSDANIDTLAELIASDVAMTAQLLHVASSAFYGLGAVNDLKQAINVMGLETTCALVLSIETLRAFEVPDWFDLEYLHADCTRITALTAELVDKELQPQAVMASMLHDVGHMVIATCFEHSSGLRNGPSSMGAERCQAEHSLLGFDHAQVGAYLLRLWRFGEEVASAVEEHHSPAVADRSPLSHALFCASWVVTHPEPDEADELLNERERETVHRARAFAAVAA